jgi:predicted rRNA methylase YqxC with S4 and FtsJ domains
LFKSVILTIDSGQSDLKIRQEERIPALRRERIKSVTKEAFKQGTLLTAEDMAYKIFSVGYRTIIRDLDILRKGGEHIPLRSTQKDTGRTTTHKEQIVKLWLEGHEPAYISKATNHSVDAVSGYLQPFKRVVALTLEGKDKKSIAFLLSISNPLVTRYQELFERYKDEALHTRIQEMQSFLKKIANGSI